MEPKDISKLVRKWFPKLLGKSYGADDIGGTLYELIKMNANRAKAENAFYYVRFYNKIKDFEDCEKSYMYGVDLINQMCKNIRLEHRIFVC